MLASTVHVYHWPARFRPVVVFRPCNCVVRMVPTQGAANGSKSHSCVGHLPALGRDCRQCCLMELLLAAATIVLLLPPLFCCCHYCLAVATTVFLLPPLFCCCHYCLAVATTVFLLPPLLIHRCCHSTTCKLDQCCHTTTCKLPALLDFAVLASYPSALLAAASCGCASYRHSCMAPTSGAAATLVRFYSTRHGMSQVVHVLPHAVSIMRGGSFPLIFNDACDVSSAEQPAYC